MISLQFNPKEGEPSTLSLNQMDLNGVELMIQNDMQDEAEINIVDINFSHLIKDFWQMNLKDKSPEDFESIVFTDEGIDESFVAIPIDIRFSVIYSARRRGEGLFVRFIYQ